MSFSNISIQWIIFTTESGSLLLKKLCFCLLLANRGLLRKCCYQKAKELCSFLSNFLRFYVDILTALAHLSVGGGCPDCQNNHTETMLSEILFGK